MVASRGWSADTFMVNEPSESNPYLAPQSRPDLPSFFEDKYSVHVASRSPFHRHLIISGPVPCVIEYSASGIGYEIVRVNWMHVKRVMNPTLFGPTLTPRIDLTIPTATGAVPACLEVKSFLLVFIGAMRLSVAQQIVYCEGKW